MIFDTVEWKMRPFTVLPVACVLFMMSAASNAYEWKTYNGHQYALTTNLGIWSDMEAEAVAAGGHLVTIDDAAENEWLGRTFENAYCRTHYGDPEFNIAWTGLYRDNDSQWKWISGEPLTYTNFVPSLSPDGMHAYLHLLNWQYLPTPFTWSNNPLHDNPACYGEHPRGIIEVVPEPATMLLALGGLPFLRRRRNHQAM